MNEPRLITLGEEMALIISDDGRLGVGAAVSVGVAGAEGNVAVAAARLGVRSVWVGALGDDDLGRLVLRELRAEGVTAISRIDPTAPTGVIVKSRPRAGLTRVSYHRTGSAASRIEPDDIQHVEIDPGDIVHVTGITAAISESARTTLHALLERAAERGAIVSFDVNHREKLWSAPSAAPHYREIAARADIVFGGADELRLLVDTPHLDDETLAREVLTLGPREAVAKRGPDGCLVVDASTVHRTPAIDVDVVDTVGAGDAFVGAYLAGILRGASITERSCDAVLAGALACTTPGDRDGSPTLRELREWSPTTRDPVSR